MAPEPTRGFFTFAQGPIYLRAAYALGLSLLNQGGPYKLTVGVESRDVLKNAAYPYDDVFDVVEIPWGDHAKDSKWKMENEWKAIYMTPYDYTIKLDADMLFFGDIASWWPVLEQSDMVFATKVMTYRGEVANGDPYRKVFTVNELPNVYSGFFFFKKSPAAHEFFKLAEQIFYDWQRFYYEFLEPNERPTIFSTDVAYAIAAKILGITELNNHPNSGIPTFTHYKARLQNWPVETLIGEHVSDHVTAHFTRDCNCKIGGYLQQYPLHYHEKNFLTEEMIKFLEDTA